jgi:hypothetical protein
VNKFTGVALFTLLSIAVAPPGSAQAPAPRGAAEPMPTIKGHLIGESFLDFLAKEPQRKSDLDSCHQPNASIIKGIYDCQSLLGAENGETSSIRARDADFFFRDRKLQVISALLDTDFDSAEKSAEEKFGRPSDRQIIPMQNGFGAKWNERFITWDTPVLYVTLTEDGNPGRNDQRPFLDVHSRSEHDLEQKERDSKEKSPLD